MARGGGPDSRYNLIGQNKCCTTTLYRYTPSYTDSQQPSIVIMEQQLHLRDKLKLSSPHFLDDSTLHEKSAPPHPDIQIEEVDPVTFDSDPRNQTEDDYPDGGLRAWLVVLGVRHPACLSLWADSETIMPQAACSMFST
jgi:hypothetical protein